jgi:hypothetical protein
MGGWMETRHIEETRYLRALLGRQGGASLHPGYQEIVIALFKYSAAVIEA